VLVCIELGGQSILVDQAVQVRHVGATNKMLIAVVFFGNDVNVFRAWYLANSEGAAGDQGKNCKRKAAGRRHV
jgi:hypothetical protein